MLPRLLKQSIKGLWEGCTIEPCCATEILILLAILVHRGSISLSKALILLLLVIGLGYAAVCAFSFYDNRNLL
jgi:hypothetical protein